jgi:predicted nucleic acid-binding Zn ribbon protein
MPDRKFTDDSGAKLISKRKRILNYQDRKTTMKWIGIIVLIAVIVIILMNVVPLLFQKFDIVDTTYRPRDVERQYHQIQKLREGEPDKIQKGNYQQIK